MTADRKVIKAQVLKALASGQKHLGELESLLGADYTQITAALTSLMRAGEAVRLGTAGEAGYVDVRSTIPVYGLPGSTLVRLPARKRKLSTGSGQIAGRIQIHGYRWGSSRLG